MCIQNRMLLYNANNIFVCLCYLCSLFCDFWIPLKLCRIQCRHNSVIVYSSSICFIPVWVSFFCQTKNGIFRRTKQLLVAIDFHSMGEKNTIKVNGYQKLFGYQHSSKYLFFFFLSSTEETHTGLEQLECK